MEKQILVETTAPSVVTVQPSPVPDHRDQQINELKKEVQTLATVVLAKKEQVPDPRDQVVAELKKEVNSLLAIVQAKPEQVVNPLDDQIAELKKEVQSLVNVVQTKQDQSVRNSAFDNTMAEIRELKTLVKSSMAVAPKIVANQTEVKADCCNEQNCDCVSESCCCFDIVMTFVRVLGMQPLELDDSNANPWGEMEVRLFAYLDGGIGIVVPSMFSTLTLRKLIQNPGLKVSINRTIGTVCLPKGTTKMITLGVDAIEEDSGLIERATGGRDEEGSNSYPMTLDCCCCSPITATFDVSFTSGGQGGGSIEVGFAAIKKC